MRGGRGGGGERLAELKLPRRVKSFGLSRLTNKKKRLNKYRELVLID